MWMRIKVYADKAAIWLILLAISMFFIVPFVWTLITSVKINEEIYSARVIILPTVLSFMHYVNVVTKMQDFFAYTRNSAIITFWSVLGTVVFSSSTGYSFAKLRYFGQNFFLGFILLILTLPYAIYLIPIYLVESRLDLINTRWGLILPYIAINMPMAVFIMRGQFNNIPNDLMQAASIDGSSHFQTFMRIMLPIAKPGVASVIILTFIAAWGEFLFARTLTNTTAAQTIAVGITFLRDEASSWAYGTLSATITLTLIPLLIIFLSMQKYFIKGIMEGALKG